MAINIPRGHSDQTIDAIISCLERYQVDHPRAQMDVYRQDPVSVRIRIVDPDFVGTGKPERSQRIWNYLDDLTADAQSDISTVLLLTPEETRNSFANFEFDDPVSSKL
ncbi:MAG: hypothetical protein LC104_00850 [Bacteroidales bacterium]|nr:hypothetical protein [Bacteroidales bacterium]